MLSLIFGWHKKLEEFFLNVTKLIICEYTVGRCGLEDAKRTG
jgi:hypothetical protein